jgi:hypothetical protein
MNDELSDKELEEFHQQVKGICKELEMYCRFMDRYMDEILTHPAPTPRPTPQPASTRPRLSNPPTQEEMRAYREWMRSDDPEAIRGREAAKRRFQERYGKWVL